MRVTSLRGSVDFRKERTSQVVLGRKITVCCPLTSCTVPRGRYVRVVMHIVCSGAVAKCTSLPTQCLRTFGCVCGASSVGL